MSSLVIRFMYQYRRASDVMLTVQQAAETYANKPEVYLVVVVVILTPSGEGRNLLETLRRDSMVTYASLSISMNFVCAAG